EHLRSKAVGGICRRLRYTRANRVRASPGPFALPTKFRCFRRTGRGSCRLIRTAQNVSHSRPNSVSLHSRVAHSGSYLFAVSYELSSETLSYTRRHQQLWNGSPECWGGLIKVIARAAAAMALIAALMGTSSTSASAEQTGLIAIGGADRTIRLCDSAGKQLQSFLAHDGAVTCLAF